MLFREYQPQAVIRAENEPLQIYSGEELRQVCRTDKPLPIFFYDIYLLPNGRELIALQAKEFSHLFQGFKVYHNSNLLEVTKKDIGGRDSEDQSIILWRASLPRAYKNGIRVSIGDGEGESLEVDIAPYPFAGHPVARIMQQTMQKDYPLLWIRDHVLFMHRLHSIERYVFYDNGSQDYRGLIEHLREISRTEGIEILLINWPFPHSRLWRLEKRKTLHDNYPQRAAFNHGFYMFEKITKYAMNLDLDEYLFNHSFLSLYTCIKLRFLLAPLIYIPASTIPNYPDKKKLDIVRANSFSYRDTGYPGGDKYIYKADTKRIEYLSIHLAHEIRVMGFLRSSSMNERLFKCFHRIGGFLLRMTVLSSEKDALVFYHFKGINTGWRRFMIQNLKKLPEERESVMSTRNWGLITPKSLDPEWVPFDYIKKAFKKIGLD